MLPVKTLSVPQVFGHGLKLWLLTFVKILPLFLLFFIWLSIPHVWLHGRALTAVLEKTQMSLVRFIVYIAIYLMGIFILYIAVYVAMHRVALGETGNFINAIGAGVKKLPILVIACLVSMVAVIVGLLLLLVPGAYLSLVIALFYPLIILDNINNPFRGLKYFLQLLWGNWWRTFAVAFVPTVLFWFIGVFITQGVEHFEIKHILNQHIWAIDSGVQVLLSTLYLSVTAGFFIIQLNDLKLRLCLQQKIKNSHSTNFEKKSLMETHLHK